jgi:very-short-patch-repair endonuclease
MGWEDLKIAVEYEGDHHRTNRNQFNKDIRRMDTLLEQGWIVIRVTALDTQGVIVGRVAAARARRA